MTIHTLFAGVPVTELDSMVAWYVRLLGRPPDLVPNDSEAAWQLAGTGWIYVVANPERAGNGLLTLLVDDLDGTLAELADRGLATGPIESVTGSVRKAELADPEGNRITLGEAPR
jgi:predicted enzyme related to lactoylglutathione lyase